jgi:hypothetical protein
MKNNAPNLASEKKETNGDRALPAYRFSGHETFPFRYSWLPKAFAELNKDKTLFSDDERAMVRLGVGKNMVKSIRFWVQVCGIASPDIRGLAITDFGRGLLAETDGADPYLEDIRTLWLIHWKIASNAREPLFAWEYLLNHWQHPTVTRGEVLAAFTQEAVRMQKELSSITLAQHFDTFLHTYVPTRSPKGEVREENLDSPLVELDLIRRSGEQRPSDGGRLEPVYVFNRESKHSITPQLFAYCINDYWDVRAPNEESLTFRDIAVSLGSVGQVFKLPEADIRERLQHLEEDSQGAFVYRESAATSSLTKNSAKLQNLFASVYETENVYA